MNPNVKLDQDVLTQLCRKWRVRELSLFGSALRPDFNAESDLDFLVSFEPDSGLNLFDLIEMREEWARAFGRPVDLVEKEALRNPWRRREILSTREVVYAA